MFVRNAPDDYLALIAPIPSDVTILKRVGKELDLIHLFSKKESELRECIPLYIKRIKQDGMIWISWPKKASKVPTDITEDTIREIVLPLDLVDVKVCAVDDVWSGLKVVIRKEKRK